jgi:hypothetical protein
VSKWSELAKAKLASSGLDTKIAEQLGMSEVASAIQLDPSFEAVPALKLPYHGLNGEPLSGRPKWPPFYRIRYLESTKKGFAKVGDKKERRYTQPANTGVAPYLPKTLNWKNIARDTEQAIIITEGELKSAAACEVGYPTMGLGGVWNFRSTTDGLFFLPILEKIDWVRRDVFICYDSDYAENPNICAAMNRLGEELMERGAMPYVLMLPDVVDDGKTGLDDYFLENSADDFDLLIAQAEPITLSTALWRLNKEVIYVENPGLVVVETSGQKMSPSHFKEYSRWATISTPERTVTKDGDIGIKKVAAAPTWIRWPMRRTATEVTYAPGQDRITDEGAYNQWEGWGVEPEKGDIRPFMDLIDFIFGDAEKGAKDWFLDWAAYPLQNPGVKMFSSVLIHGVMEGTGKSLIGYTLGRIYGDNFKEITDDDLKGGYTAWAENKQFILGDEITGSDKREHADTLKRLITQRSITINTKFIPHYSVPDCINYFFTSNHPDAFFMSDNDRRFFINEVIGDPLPQSFYDRYNEWLWGDGPKALFHYLLSRDISKFNPNAAAFRTAAKERMVLTGKGELASWVRELKENPDWHLRFGQQKHTRDLFTAKEIFDIYKTEHPEAKTSVVGMGRALSSAGFQQVDNGQPLTGPDGKGGRYFAIRNGAYWRKCKSRKEMEANLKKPTARMGK